MSFTLDISIYDPSNGNLTPIISGDNISIGQILRISISTDDDSLLYFNVPFNKNVVTFGDVIGKIVTAIPATPANPTSIDVLVPSGIYSGDILVERFIGTSTISEPFSYILIHEDQFFEQTPPKDYSKATINGKVKTLGASSIGLSPTYTVDMSYSNFNEVVDENSLIQNLFTIVLTQKGQRLFNPQFGTNLEKILFSLISDTGNFEQKILSEIISAVNQYEDRISIIENQSFVTYNDNNNNVYVILAVLLPTGIIEEVGITLKSIRNTAN